MKLEDMNERKCVTCGQPIPPARLEVFPEAMHCVPCAGRFDKKQRATLKPDPNGPYPRGW